jgi:SAM-dependent methyltransferase
MNTGTKKPRYGSWVSTRLISKFMALFLIFGIFDIVLWVFPQGWLPLKILLTLLTAFFLACVGYLFRARWWLAAEGGDIQNKILDLLVSRIDWNGNGRALDIGCGSGALTIRLAKKYNETKITGIDYWGREWGYCQKQCEENAIIEGVAGRTEFLQASASKLPFSDDTFDLAVSNLTFHEVRDSESKLDAIREALRVVKKGGRFVFQDLFLIRQYYGTPDELIAAVKAMGAREARFVDNSKSTFIPGSLKLPFMIGTLGLIYGEKH